MRGLLLVALLLTAAPSLADAPEWEQAHAMAAAIEAPGFPRARPAYGT